MRVVILGLDCAFSNAVLETLLDSSVAISAIILPGPPSAPKPIRANLQRRSITLSAPGGQPPGILATADTHEIPVWRVGDLRTERTLAMIASIQAELLVCACFNRKVPAALYESFALGGVNVHPSLLPDKRGPDPQFWTLKEGTGQTGVTIHSLSPRFDAGPTLARGELSYPDGIAESDLDVLTASAGARLLVDLLPGLTAGTVTAVEQDNSQATYAPFPTAGDFRLDLSRPARSAYNFVRGVTGRGIPILLDWKGETRRVLEALEYSDKLPPSPNEDAPATWIPFTPGWALLLLAPGTAG